MLRLPRFTLFVWLAACTPPPSSDATSFDSAESALARGDYDEARAGYRAFISTYPSHPLARLARERLRIIERELDAVQRRDGGAAPTYVNPRAAAKSGVTGVEAR
jgi:hypothetical protein